MTSLGFETEKFANAVKKAKEDIEKQNTAITEGKNAFAGVEKKWNDKL